MARNDWINSCLEAILDVGPGLDDAKSSLLLRERGRSSPTRYFLEKVITGFDETDLHRSWVKAQAARSPQERNTRLENMCWRIRNLARQKKQLERELAQTNAKRHIERESGQREANALLKLVADKQLWAKCRQNGLKNIHLFPWPEHCKTYLPRIATCKARHP